MPRKAGADCNGGRPHYSWFMTGCAGFVTPARTNFLFSPSVASDGVVMNVLGNLEDIPLSLLQSMSPGEFCRLSGDGSGFV